MNKLLVDKDCIIPTGIHELILNENSQIKISRDAKIYQIDSHNKTLEIECLDNSVLDFHKIDYLSKDTNLNIIINNRAKVELNWLILNKGNNKVVINVIMQGDNSYCSLKVRILNEGDSKINFICLGKINKDTFDNEILEDLKGLITNNDAIKISPNIEVETNEVMANHLVTIGSYNEQELFYLMSKGLSRDLACELLKKGFMYQVLDEDATKLLERVVKIGEDR